MARPILDAIAGEARHRLLGGLVGGLARIGQALFAQGGPMEMPPAVPGGLPETVQIPKGILRSRSVWASGLSAIFAVASAFGWEIPFSEADAQTAFAVLSAILAALAGFFRVRATTPTRG